jgi:hypothetical protein
MLGEKWVARQTNDNFWLEASFLTLWGAGRELRRADFACSFHDFNGFRSYLKFWPSEVYAVARIHPKTSRTGRVKVTISYYDGRGNRFREVALRDERGALGASSLVEPLRR